MAQLFQIRLQGTADTRQWVQAQGVLRNLDSEASKFVDSLRAGVGIDLGGRLVSTLGSLPGILTDTLRRGFEFNKTMSDSEVAIANVIAKFQKLDETAAKAEAAKVMAEIIRLEPESAASLQGLVEGYLAIAAAAQSAGITSLQAVDLVGVLANALANANIPAEQLSQELRSILTGNITSDSALAKILEITPRMVEDAKNAGNLYELLIQRVGALGRAGDTAGVALSTLESAVDKAAGTLARPLFNEAIQGAKDLAEAFEDPQIIAALEQAGIKIGDVVASGVDLTKWATENAPKLIAVAEALVKIGAALAALKIATIVAGLIRQAATWGTNTVAVQANTAALAANTTAATTNAAARQAAAAVPAVLPNVAAGGGAAAGTAAAGGFAGAFQRRLPGLLNAIGIGSIIYFVAKPAFEALFAALEDDIEKAANERDAQFKGQAPGFRVAVKISEAVTPEQKAAAKNFAVGMVVALQKELALALADKNDKLAQSINAEIAIITRQIRDFDRRAGLLGTQSPEAAAQKLVDAQEGFNRQLDALRAKAGDSEAELASLSAAYDNLREKLEKQLDVDLSGLKDFESILSKITPEQLAGDSGAKATALLDDLAEAYGKVQQKTQELEQQERDRIQTQRQMETDLLELKVRALEAAGNAAAAKNAQVLLEARQLAESLFSAGAFETFEEALKKTTDLINQEAAAEKAKEDQKINRARAQAELEDQINQARASRNETLTRELEDKLRILQVTQQIMDQERRTAEEAGRIAQQRVANERAAQDAQERASRSGRDLDRVFEERARQLDEGSTARRAGSALDAFNERNRTRLRDEFQFPSLDAFQRLQSDPNRRRPVSSVPVPIRPAARPGSPALDGGVDQATQALEQRQASTQQQLTSVTQQIQRITGLIAQHGREDTSNWQKMRAALQQMEQRLQRDIEVVKARQANNRT